MGEDSFVTVTCFRVIVMTSSISPSKLMLFLSFEVASLFLFFEFVGEDEGAFSTFAALSIRFMGGGVRKSISATSCGFGCRGDDVLGNTEAREGPLAGWRGGEFSRACVELSCFR